MEQTNSTTSSDAVDRLHDELQAALAELVTSEDWQAALAVAARFHRFSFSNTRLIWVQAAERGFEPTRVTGYRSWRDLDRQVRRGERGLSILAPIVRMVEADDGTEERRVVGFRPVHVFDISQTDGAPLREVTPVLLDGDLPECWDQVADLITTAGFGLDIADDPTRLGEANGVTDMLARRVTIRGNLSGEQRFKTAVHELAHIQLHEPGREGRPDCRGVVEVEAESVAYMVCASVGIDSAEYSLPYVATWSGGDLDKVAATANRVIGSARSVIDRLGRDRTLERSRDGRDVGEAGSPVLARTRSVERATKGVWDVATEPNPTDNPPGEMRVVVEAAAEFFAQRLHGPHGATARDYLEERGLGSETVEGWRLGYAPPSWNALTQHLQQAGFDDDLLVSAGVAARAPSGRLYDMMRGRLIFPLLDSTGEPVGFAGRLITGDGPKYLNGPETSLYAKRTLLYGLHAARDDIAAQDRVVVVEGYTDVLAAHQVGYRNVVGTGGTALTPEHVDSLGGRAAEVVLCFDGDAAGQLAVEHNLEWLRTAPARVRVAQLPVNSDPADLLLGGRSDAFEWSVEEAVPLTTHLIDRIVDRYDLNEVEGPVRVLLAASRIVDPIETPDERSVAVSHLATRLGRDQEFIQSAIHRYAGIPQRSRERTSLGRSLG